MRVFWIAGLILVAAIVLRAPTIAQEPVVFASPHATYSPQPEYPADAKAANVSGAVVIQVQIDVTGNVTDAKVVSGHAMLTESALKTVRTWKFEPTQINGRAVPVTSTITVNFGAAAPPASAPPPAGQPLRLGAGVTAPAVIFRVDPQYSDQARQARIQGTVVLEAIVRRDGSVDVNRVVRGLGAGLDENAESAIRQWKFRPATRDGQPVDVLLNVEVNFNLAAGPTPAALPATPPAQGFAPALLNQVATENADKVIGSLKWEIREEATGKIIAQGDGPVHLKDVSINDLAYTVQITGKRQTPKRIRLNEQFSIEMAEFPVPNVTDKQGFGLTARKTDIQSFSWEWFNIQDSRHALKLQEGGALDIDLKQVGTDWEITRTDFATDVSLRIIRMGVDPPGSPPYWRVNIFKGSSITWPSIVNGKVVSN